MSRGARSVISAWDQHLSRRSKYQGDWDLAVKDGMLHHEDGGSAVVFEVVPTKVLAFAKGQFAQTRYRFPTAHE